VLTELQKGREENCMLGNQLQLIEQRHQVELHNLKASIMNAQSEHMCSVKKRMETSFHERVIQQVKTKQLANEITIKDREIETLKRRIRQ